MVNLKIFVASIWDLFSPPLSAAERDPAYTEKKLRWDRCGYFSFNRSMMDLTTSKSVNASMDTQDSPRIWQALRIFMLAEITKRRGSG